MFKKISGKKMMTPNKVATLQVKTLDTRIAPVELNHQGPFAARSNNGWTEDASVADAATEKHVVQDFGNSTTLHGLRYLSESNSHLIRKIVWTLIILSALIYTTINITLNVIQYLDKDTSTKTNVIYSDTKMFPAVTICNLNQWRRSSLDYWSYLMLCSIYGDEDEIAQFDWDSYYEYSDNPHNISLTALALSTKGVLPAEEMILECKWQGQQCSHEDFTRVMTDLGVCYQFNNPKNLQEAYVVNRPGIKSGLTLTLDIHHYDYIHGELEGAGVKVLLHTPGERPLMKELGFAISPGFETLVSITHTKSKTMPHPYQSNCTKEELRFSSSYSVPLCHYGCMTDYIISVIYTKDHDRNALAPSMQSNIYEGRLSSSYWPANPKAYSLLTEFDNLYEDLEDLRNNLARVRIYFEHLSHVEVQQVPSYGLPSLLSEIGGTMGLFCGMSLITLCEFADLIIVLLFKKYKS
ncbi:acid-sensing ion channel 2-like [Amphiura filiformis]|uniref:acid-sensing ion channel 2-like n=1 Tax=Amphiura filiformis TaxID=82378 RepID=UPI003B21420C